MPPTAPSPSLAATGDGESACGARVVSEGRESALVLPANGPLHTRASSSNERALVNGPARHCSDSANERGPSRPPKNLSDEKNRCYDGRIRVRVLSTALRFEEGFPWPYTEYTISTSISTSDGGRMRCGCRRRFKEFLQLHGALSAALPPLPSALQQHHTHLTRFLPEVIAERSAFSIDFRLLGFSSSGGGGKS